MANKHTLWDLHIMVLGCPALCTLQSVASEALLSSLTGPGRVGWAHKTYYPPATAKLPSRGACRAVVQLPDEEHLHPVWLCLLRHIASMMPAWLHRCLDGIQPKIMIWQGSGHSTSLNEDLRRGNMNSSRSSCAIQKDDFCLRVGGATGFRV